MRLGSSDAGSGPGEHNDAQGLRPARGKASVRATAARWSLVAQVHGPAQQAAFHTRRSPRRRSHQGRRAGDQHPCRDRRPRPDDGRGDRRRVSRRLTPGGVDQHAPWSTLRHFDSVVPAASAGSGVHVLIGGQTAIFDDFSTVLSGKLPLFIGVVVLLSFLLLTAVFRSLLIPAMAAAMNLLTAAASFGLITAVFQWGWAASLFGIDKTGPIEAFVPVMMFAIVFGLSMDYQVFLVTRIYEEWHRTGDNQLAVTRGLAATGRTITAAAAIMVLVFGAFILGGERVIMLFGLGLSAAVFLDALIVRSVLVPGLMLARRAAELGRSLRSLDRLLPHLNVEGSVHDEPQGTPAPRRAPTVHRRPTASPIIRAGPESDCGHRIEQEGW